MMIIRPTIPAVGVFRPILISLTLIFSGLVYLNHDYQYDESTNLDYHTASDNIADIKSIWFMENKGQIKGENVRFLTSSGGIKFLDSAILIEEKIGQNNKAIRVTFPGSNMVRPSGDGKLVHNSSFFLGNNSDDWTTTVQNYQRVVYYNLYYNIDLIYYFSSDGLKYDWLVNPGGDPNVIRQHYNGAKNMIITSTGNLKIFFSNSLLTEASPISYQNGNKISSQYHLIDEMTISYQIEPYNKSQLLVIDPLMYSTFVGGKHVDYGRDITLDNEGNVIVVGTTRSIDFPISNETYSTEYNGGFSDIFIYKLSNDGSKLLFSTFVGGIGYDVANSVITDEKGNIYLTGWTNSNDFPTTTVFNNTTNNHSQQNVFILKLLSDGSKLIFSTIISGSEEERGSGISIDADSVYVTGTTNSPDFVTTFEALDSSYNGGDYDIFIVKLSKNGTDLIYSTFLGGNGNDEGRGLIVDSNGKIYITGRTSSNDFPTSTNSYDDSYNGNFDSFVTIINNKATEILFSTFVGGLENDGANEIALDYNSNIFIVGYTYSNDYPTTQNIYDSTFNGDIDVFVTKIDSEDLELAYSTLIGGSDYEYGTSIFIDKKGNAYVTGTTKSEDFPTTAGAYDRCFNGVDDAFVLKLSADGTNLVYSTYIGGFTYGETGNGISVDNSGIIYVTGDTDSKDFPNTMGAFDTSYNGRTDTFIIKLEAKPDSEDNACDSDSKLFGLNLVFIVIVILTVLFFRRHRKNMPKR